MTERLEKEIREIERTMTKDKVDLVKTCFVEAMHIDSFEINSDYDEMLELMRFALKKLSVTVEMDDVSYEEFDLHAYADNLMDEDVNSMDEDEYKCKGYTAIYYSWLNLANRLYEKGVKVYGPDDCEEFVELHDEIMNKVATQVETNKICRVNNIKKRKSSNVLAWITIPSAALMASCGMILLVAEQLCK